MLLKSAKITNSDFIIPANLLKSLCLKLNNLEITSYKIKFVFRKFFSILGLVLKCCRINFLNYF